MTYHAKVIAGGKIALPAALRREFGIKDGDSLVFEQTETGISVKTHAQVVREGQQKFRAMVGDDFTVDQFLAERRAEWGDD